MVAKALGVSPSTFGRLLNGGSISAEMALRLSKTLGRSPGSWLAMQAQYDLWTAQKENKTRLKDVKKFTFPKVA